jgi:hypothetical protein
MGGRKRHQRGGQERGRQLEHVRRDGQPFEREREQPDQQAEPGSEPDVERPAAEKAGARRRHDRVADHAQPPRVRRLSTDDLLDARRPVLRPEVAREYAFRHLVQRRQPTEIELAGLHADQVCLLRLQRPERRHDCRRGGKELGDEPEPIGHMREHVFEAVRRVPGSVQGMS